MIVWPSPLDVSTYALRGRTVEPPTVRCPGCGGQTRAWSGYRRHLRADALLVVFVPRVRCRSCGRTDALLPWFALPYRFDSVDVVGAALELHAGGLGVRPIAAALARPETTVRDWVRRFGRNAAALSIRLLAAAVAAGWSGFELPTEARARATAAVTALASVWARHRNAASPWRLAALVTGGGLLARNTGSPLAPPEVPAVMTRTAERRSGGAPWPQPIPPKRSPSGDTT